MPERSFGRTVRYRRTQLGLSQTELGGLVGRSPSTVRSWERDTSHPNDPHVLTALAAILGVDERSLFEKAGQTQPELEASPTIEQELATITPDSEELPEVGEESGPGPAPALIASPPTNLTTTTLPPAYEPSYMEDRFQRQLYRVRNLATIVILVALGIAFLWAFSESLGALGVWWDDFFGNLRL